MAGDGFIISYNIKNRPPVGCNMFPFPRDHEKFALILLDKVISKNAGPIGQLVGFLLQLPENTSPVQRCHLQRDARSPAGDTDCEQRQPPDGHRRGFLVILSLAPKPWHADPAQLHSHQPLGAGGGVLPQCQGWGIVSKHEESSLWQLKIHMVMARL